MINLTVIEGSPVSLCIVSGLSNALELDITFNDSSDKQMRCLGSPYGIMDYTSGRTIRINSTTCLYYFTTTNSGNYTCQVYPASSICPNLTSNTINIQGESVLTDYRIAFLATLIVSGFFLMVTCTTVYISYMMKCLLRKGKSH